MKARACPTRHHGTRSSSGFLANARERPDQRSDPGEQESFSPVVENSLNASLRGVVLLLRLLVATTSGLGWREVIVLMALPPFLGG